MSIPKPEEVAVQSPIPITATEIPQTAEAPEVQPVFISFQRYNSTECELNGMDNKRARKALQIVRDVGVTVKTEADFHKHLPNLKIVSIQNNGAYKKLYKGLVDMPDAEIKEAKIDRDKGRLFFFMIDRIFHIIAIKDSHYETNQQRR